MLGCPSCQWGCQPRTRSPTCTNTVGAECPQTPLMSPWEGLRKVPFSLFFGGSVTQECGSLSRPALGFPSRSFSPLRLALCSGDTHPVPSGTGPPFTFFSTLGPRNIILRSLLRQGWLARSPSAWEGGKPLTPARFGLTSCARRWRKKKAKGVPEGTGLAEHKARNPGERKTGKPRAGQRPAPGTLPHIP